MSSAKWRPFCLGLNMLKNLYSLNASGKVGFCEFQYYAQYCVMFYSLAICLRHRFQGVRGSFSYCDLLTRIFHILVIHNYYHCLGTSLPSNIAGRPRYVTTNETHIITDHGCPECWHHWFINCWLHFYLCFFEDRATKHTNGWDIFMVWIWMW